MSEDLSEFYQEFFNESQEHLEKINEVLLAHDEEGFSEEQLTTLLTHISALKSSSGVLDLHFITELTQNIETLLDEIKLGHQALTAEVKEALTDAVTAIGESVEVIKSEDSGETDEIKLANDKVLSFLDNVTQAEVAEAELIDEPEAEGVPSEDEVDESVESDDKGRNAQSIVDDDFRIMFKDNELVIDSEGVDVHRVKEESLAQDENTDDEPDGEVEQVIDEDDLLEPVETFINADTLGVPRGALDNLMAQFGALIESKSKLAQTLDADSKDLDLLFDQAILQLEQDIRHLRESLMAITRIPIKPIFKRLYREAVNAAKYHKKKVKFEIEPNDISLDYHLYQYIEGPLLALIENAIEHGIEDEQDRLAANKDATGKIILSAYEAKGQVCLEIKDDGGGIDTDAIRQKLILQGVISRADELSTEELLDYLFVPGFFTSEPKESARLSGFADIKKKIQALKGYIDISSSLGDGVKITVRLPISQSLIDGQLFKVADYTFILPIPAIMEIIPLDKTKVKYLPQEIHAIHPYKNGYVPIICMQDFFSAKPKEKTKNFDAGMLIVVESKNKKIGLFLDELLHEQQVALKSIEENFKPIPGFLGAAVLGDNSVSLVIDVDTVQDLSARFDDTLTRQDNRLETMKES